MNQIEQLPFSKEVPAPPKVSRVPYLLESLAIVLIAALAAYGAS